VSTAQHWDAAYDQGETTRSWFQEQADQSLRMFDAAGVAVADGVIDVGGGASHLVDALLARGHRDITVLDVSARAIELAQTRLGEAAERVAWVVADVFHWRPSRSYDVWHDRALLHFLTTRSERRRYLEALHTATVPGAVAVLATFAPDGPDHCSGLSVERYDADGLSALLGPDWELVTSDREEHVTPSGAVQPFTWVVLRRGA
jgi:trans-aconitate methyltransferase